MFIRFAPIPASLARSLAGAYGIKRRIKRTGQVGSLIQPEIFYSDPIKHAQILNEQEVMVPVKLALLYLIHTTVINEFKMIEEKGNCALYFPTTEPGERYRL